MNGIIDLGELGKPKKPKALSFNRDIFRMRGIIDDGRYTARLCDEAIGCGILTVREFRELIARYEKRPRHFIRRLFEQLILNRIKEVKKNYYWEEKNFSANKDNFLDKIVNANTKADRNGRKKGI